LSGSFAPSSLFQIAPSVPASVGYACVRFVQAIHSDEDDGCPAIATGVAGAEALVIEGGTMGLGTPLAIAMVVGNGAALFVAAWKAYEAITKP